MLRELSSVFLAAYTVVLLVLVSKVHDGQAAFEDFVDTLQSPLLIAFHIVALAFALLHTATWFQAVPQAIRVFHGEDRVPAQALVGTHFLAWAGITVVILAIVLVEL